MSKVHVKTGDKVVVINGKYRGKQGKVMQVSPSEGKVIVEGVNIVTKHVKPRSAERRQGSADLPQVRQTHQSRSQDQRKGQEGSRLQEERLPCRV